MKRLVRAQFHGVWNSPIFDGIPSDVLDQQHQEKLKRLIKDKQYDPTREADSGESQVFDFPPYKVKAIRFTFNPSNNMDDGNNDFFNASRDARNDQWSLALLDQSGNQIATKSVMIPKASDISSILELEAKRFIQEQQL
jgi:hypothetical protein